MPEQKFLKKKNNPISFCANSKKMDRFQIEHLLFVDLEIGNVLTQRVHSGLFGLVAKVSGSKLVQNAAVKGYTTLVQMDVGVELGPDQQAVMGT